MHSYTTWGSSCIHAHADLDFISSQKAQFYSREVSRINCTDQTPCFCVATLIMKVNSESVTMVPRFFFLYTEMAVKATLMNTSWLALPT